MTSTKNVQRHGTVTLGERTFPADINMTITTTTSVRYADGIIKADASDLREAMNAAEVSITIDEGEMQIVLTRWSPGDG